MRPKTHAFVVEPTQPGQRENLETSRVGEDRSGPVHEPMQAAQLADQLVPGAQEQMVGVGQHDLRAADT